MRYRFSDLAADAFSIAAVNIATAGGSRFTGGSANPIETFSSDGPRRIFYSANGTPLTPGNFTSTGGVVRIKPDLAAADGVSTATAGFHPFLGTSAVAPYAAATAALMLSADPTLSLAELRATLTSTALDIMAPEVDRDSGAGLIDAEAAVAAVAANAGACVRDTRTACLLNGRLEIKVSWTNTSSTGEAQVMAFGGQRTENDQSVFFWFFSPANFEMGVKAVNACGPNQKLWVFVSGLTDRGWTVHARDTQTGATREYTNALAHLSSTVADTSAFSCN